ncbi:MAG: hypothetical protein A3B13_03525 [Candidatus Liptonbacteria bacterium RIFCSPLOWO2_01_FULL_45_15]|uniref:Uncharacterized protein n=1 Tax=Candidatus Liptonbacteria bacterium RIFCSPLOWO2_01_FULL_45_15 TaxID=1798649 RepID=A0A1G2CIR4_9BACT|nr:MAG: hypothetical protein A3B13_03525 [Candidatus Liptonbacteria bacterium RIFCSPLOWO2_01_FULL_45_15]
MLNKFDFTAGEYVEAQDKKEQREKGREEAKFYRHLLDSFKRRVADQLVRKDLSRKLGEIDLNTTTLKLREFEFCDPYSLNEYIKQAMEEANEVVDNPPKSVSVNPEQLADMTPSEFVVYIENLKSSLIKD